MKELLLYQELKEEGRKEGREEERINGIKALIESFQETGLPREAAVSQIMKKFSLTRGQAEDYSKTYWK